MLDTLELINFEQDLPVRVLVQNLDRYKLHWHSQVEIIFVAKGTLDVFVAHKYYTLHENEMMLINGEEVHSTNSKDSDNLLLVIQFQEHYVYDPRKYQVNIEKLLEDQKKHPDHFKKIINQLIDIAWEVDKRTTGYKFAVASLMNNVISFLMRNDYVYPSLGERSDRDTNLGRLSRIMRFVNDHYQDDVSLSSLAEQENLSYHYLSHLFKKLAGLTYSEYLNEIRLNRASELLIKTLKQISSIGSECGIHNPKSFRNAFKAKFDCTPSEYRSKFTHDSLIIPDADFLVGNENETYYRSVNNFEGLRSIFEKRKLDQTQPQAIKYETNKVDYPISLDISSKLYKFDRSYQMMTTFSRAHEGLRADVREQLTSFQRDLHFKYVRFHGIFNDEMMVFNLNNEGNPVYNWIYVDSLFDYLLSIGLKPFLELGFMPSQIASGDKVVFWWKGNVTQPKEITLWTNMVIALINHSIDRYGVDEVLSWYFEVWNEPDYENVFWAGSQKDYFEFYNKTAHAIKSINALLNVGGPAITGIKGKFNQWVPQFVLYCEKNNVPLDFISFHIYCEQAEEYAQTKDVHNFPMIPKRSLSLNNPVKRVIKMRLESVQTVSKKSYPFHITEWNLTAKPRFLIRDTAYMAPFIIHSMINLNKQVDSIGFWTFTDAMEELKAPLSIFHGGLGIMTHNGIKKSAFYAFSFLNQLEDDVIDQGEGYIVTQYQDKIVALFYHLVPFTVSVINGDYSNIFPHNRYQAFIDAPNKNVDLTILGVKGKYQVVSEEINRDNGSAYDEWIKMGYPDQMTRDEVNYLKNKSIPQVKKSYMEFKEFLNCKIDLPPHGCALVTFQKVNTN